MNTSAAGQTKKYKTICCPLPLPEKPQQLPPVRPSLRSIMEDAKRTQILTLHSKPEENALFYPYWDYCRIHHQPIVWVRYRRKFAIVGWDAEPIFPCDIDESAADHLRPIVEAALTHPAHTAHYAHHHGTILGTLNERARLVAQKILVVLINSTIHFRDGKLSHEVTR